MKRGIRDRGARLCDSLNLMESSNGHDILKSSRVDMVVLMKAEIDPRCILL